MLLLAAAPARPAEVAADPHSHWAFQPLGRVAPPPPAPAGANPVDAFVLAELRPRGLELSPPADRRTLLRRVSLDLTGIPPTPEELADFLADSAPDAFARVVDRLLSSPRYGERWARHWLDLARYADSEGFKADETRPNAWRYRDYVIDAFNRDVPYDRFVREQIAGDELWPESPAAHVATGFNRHYPDESNARLLPRRRQEILNDLTDTVGSVFLGLTYECCRCHDHKYEPLTQRDYYRLQAFFAHTAAQDDTPLLPPAELRAYETKLAVWRERSRPIREAMDALLAPRRHELEKDYFDKYPDEVRAILNKPAAERTPYEQQMAAKAAQYLDPASHQYVAPLKDVLARLKPAQRAKWDELQARLDELAPLHPGELPLGACMMDLGPAAPPTYVLNRGILESPGEEVEPGLFSLLWPAAVPARPPEGQATTGRRSALAAALTDPANPLVPRVMVNRLWQHHFGRGLAATPSDLGLHGEAPTHPALLDWLAGEFVRSGWSLKQMHRLILASRTYQQGGDYRASAAAVDPANQWLWHFPRQRLEGEAIRDSALAVAGRLNSRMGGPGIFPALPTGMPAPRGGWAVEREAAERDRRSIYIFVRRNARYPMFDAFDQPDAHESCPRRNVTTSPIQALTLLNDRLTLNWAQALAGRVLAAPGATDAAATAGRAFEFALGRPPDAAESATLQQFLTDQGRRIAARQARGETLALPTPLPTGTDPVAAAALVDVCHTLLNANEFVYAP